MASTTKKVAKKAKDKAEQAGNYVADNPMKTVKIVGLVLGAYLVYKVFSKVNDAFDPIDYEDHIDVGGPVNNATISDVQANNFASQLLTAFNYTNFFGSGTDDDIIESVFAKLQNGDDFMKVYYAFGLKPYNGAGSPTGAVLENVANLDLVSWLKEELNSVTDRSLYQTVKQRIESTGFLVF